MRTALHTLVLAGAVLSAGAQAATLSLQPIVDGPASVVAPANNDYRNAGGFLATGDVLDFGQLRLDEAAQVSFFYVGNEAGYTNRLFVNGLQVDSTAGDPDRVWGDTLIGTYSMGAGLLDFGFCTSGGNSIGASGRCLDNDSLPSIFEQFGENGYRSLVFKALTDGSYLALWDDSGANNDDDFDDMIVRIQVSEVPLPGTLGLLGLGLAGLGAVRRRKA